MAPGPGYIVVLREALSSFHQSVKEYYEAQDRDPAPGSQAVAEQTAFPAPEPLITCWSSAECLLQSGYEHISLFIKAVTEPIEPIASWTCVRSMLESCALAAWLLDQTINGQSRVKRCFAHRYEGMTEQLKFGSSGDSGEGGSDL